MPQEQQHWIQATSETYTIAHGNTGSLIHWVRLGIEPTSPRTLVRLPTEPQWELPTYISFNPLHRREIWSSERLSHASTVMELTSKEIGLQTSNLRSTTGGFSTAIYTSETPRKMCRNTYAWGIISRRFWLSKPGWSLGITTSLQSWPGALYAQPQWRTTALRLTVEWMNAGVNWLTQIKGANFSIRWCHQDLPPQADKALFQSITLSTLQRQSQHLLHSHTSFNASS